MKRCPFLRDISDNIKGRFIGRLTKTEFDIIDLCRSYGCGWRIDDLAERCGKREETFVKYVFNMRVCGLLGPVGSYDRKVISEVEKQGAKDGHGPWGTDTEAYTMEQIHVIDIYGPTMKAMQLWHESLNEEWDWRDYDRRPWIAGPDVLAGGTKKITRTAREAGSMAHH